MIRLVNVEREYKASGGPIYVLRGITTDIRRGENLAVLGANGTGKTTLLKMIAGSEPPSYGQVYRDCRISLPIGSSAGFVTSLTGAENCRFVARLYGANEADVLDFVADFSELGRAMKEPYGGYSKGMRAQLAFGLSMAIDFDVYLVDESIAAGDAAFQRRCKAIFEARRDRSDVIMTSHSVDLLRDYCNVGSVLHEGQLTRFDSVDEANDFYKDVTGA